VGREQAAAKVSNTNGRAAAEAAPAAEMH